MIVFVLAADENLGIGKGTDLPWSFKKDMQFFKAVTQGERVALGRKTWESIKEVSKGLPGRKKIVIGNSGYLLNIPVSTYESIKPVDAEILHFPTTEEVLRYSKAGGVVFVIGGKQLYESLIEQTMYAIVTRVHTQADCDVFLKESVANTLQHLMKTYSVFDTDRLTKNRVKLSFTLYRTYEHGNVDEYVAKAFERGIKSIKGWFDPSGR